MNDTPQTGPHSSASRPVAPTLAERLTAAILAEDPGLSARLQHDPTAYLELIGIAARGEQHAAATLRAAVGGARSAGNSWEVIGKVLGMTRQAAQQRFGEQTPRPTGVETRVLRGLTAFSEMAALAEAGRGGWHSVGYGPLYHVLERSDTQWEHLRVLVPGSDIATLLRAGWQQIGTGWFPWAYFKRPLQAAAED